MGSIGMKAYRPSVAVMFPSKNEPLGRKKSFSLFFIMGSIFSKLIIINLRENDLKFCLYLLSKCSFVLRSVVLLSYFQALQNLSQLIKMQHQIFRTKVKDEEKNLRRADK